MTLLPSLLLLISPAATPADRVHSPVSSSRPAAPEALNSSVTFETIGLIEFRPPAAGTLIRYTLDGSEPKSDSPACCGTLRVASSLVLKAALFRPDGSSGATLAIPCTQKPGFPKNGAALSCAINIDYSEVPHLKEWALRAQKDASDYFPTLCAMLHDGGFVPSLQFTFYKDMEGVACTSGSKIAFAASWIHQHPEDTGTVIHELTHVIQAIQCDNPVWLIEGVADYVRWFNWEKKKGQRRVNAKTANYRNGYSDCGEFLDWIVRRKDPKFVLRISAAMQQNRYRQELFKEHAGKDLDALWREFIAETTANP